jgi:hypothetical protein
MARVGKSGRGYGSRTERAVTIELRHDRKIGGGLFWLWRTLCAFFSSPSHPLIVSRNIEHRLLGFQIGHVLGQSLSFLCALAPMLRIVKLRPGHKEEILLRRDAASWGEIARTLSHRLSPR